MASPATVEAQNGVNLPLTNPNIQGYAIRLSSFIAHLSVAFLIAYSTKTRRHFYLPLLSQVALTIFAIWLCRGRNQLNLSDTEFAVIQTRSPVSIYILLLVIPRLFFQRPASNKKDATSNGQSIFRGMFNSENLDWAWRRVWGLLYALCCLSVNIFHRFGKAGYIGFTQAARGPFADPITSPSLEGRPNGMVWLGLAVCSAFVYECVLHRHAKQRREIMHQLAGKRKKSLKAWPLAKRVRWGFAATWFIATKLHPWLPFLYASVMFLNWSRDMKIWAIEDDFKWTNGQLFAIPQLMILYPCSQLCYSRWQEIASFPRRLFFDTIWLISGKGQPWTNPTESDLILRNIWDAFPPDVTEEIGSSTTTLAPPLGDTNLDPFPADGTSVRSRSRHRQHRSNQGPKSTHTEHRQPQFISPDSQPISSPTTFQLNPPGFFSDAQNVNADACDFTEVGRDHNYYDHSTNVDRVYYHYRKGDHVSTALVAHAGTFAAGFATGRHGACLPVAPSHHHDSNDSIQLSMSFSLSSPTTLTTLAPMLALLILFFKNMASHWGF